MNNILEDFANGNLHPNERCFKKNSSYAQALKNVANAEHALLSALHEPEKKLLDAFIQAQDEISYLSRTDQFIYGYRLGVLMTLEVFCTSDEIVAGGEDR